MAFSDFPDQTQGVTLLQRSLQRGRLGHAYLFTGTQIEVLEALARTLAKTLNCQNSVRADGVGGAVFDASPLVRQRQNLTYGLALSWVFRTSDERVAGRD